MTETDALARLTAAGAAGVAEVKVTRVLAAGDRVVAVEHEDWNGGARKPGGRSYPAQVTALGGAYVQVRYDDPALNGGKPDIYWQDSLWRAWDGALSWRLQIETADAEFARWLTELAAADDGDPDGVPAAYLAEVAAWHALEGK